MVQLLVQEFLEHYSLKELGEQHGVYASFNKTGQLFSCNYDQISTKDDDLLSQQCRGLILASKDGRSFLDQATIINGRNNYDHLTIGKTRIIACPMFRFFNYGQGTVAEIDFNDPSISILEKLDGTCIIISKNPFSNQWLVSTRSVPEADLTMDNGIMTFRSYFEKALFDTNGMSFEELTSYLDSNFTYCFELTGALNRIVVCYPNNRITLLAVRNLTTLQEVEIGSLGLPDSIPLVKCYDWSSIEHLVNWVSTFDPTKNEGVVIKDAKFRRVKLKSAKYVALSKLRDSLGNSERNCLELILLGNEDDAIPFLSSEIVENLLKIKEGLRKAINYNDHIYESIFYKALAIRLNDKKTFALTLKNEIDQLQLIDKANQLWAPYFFNRYDHKSNSMKEFILANKKEGYWSDSFLDKILQLANAFI
jgi:hypothetical protein